VWSPDGSATAGVEIVEPPVPLDEPEQDAISKPGPGAFEAVVILPAGARATVDGTETVPPWAA